MRLFWQRFLSCQGLGHLSLLGCGLGDSRLHMPPPPEGWERREGGRARKEPALDLAFGTPSGPGEYHQPCSTSGLRACNPGSENRRSGWTTPKPGHTALLRSWHSPYHVDASPEKARTLTAESRTRTNWCPTGKLGVEMEGNCPSVCPSRYRNLSHHLRTPARRR